MDQEKKGSDGKCLKVGLSKICLDVVKEELKTYNDWLSNQNQSNRSRPITTNAENTLNQLEFQLKKKTWNLYLARENLQLVPSAKREKKARSLLGLQFHRLAKRIRLM